MTIENILWLGGGICYGIALVLILIVLGGASERPMATFNRARQRSIRRWKIFMVGLVLLIIGSFIATGAMAADKPKFTTYHLYADFGLGYNIVDGKIGDDDIDAQVIGYAAAGVIERRSNVSIELLHMSNPMEMDNGINMILIKKRFDFGKADLGESVW